MTLHSTAGRTAKPSTIEHEHGIKPMPERRHAIIVEPVSGFTYLAPHLPGLYLPELCGALALAVEAFLGGTNDAPPGIDPGRYWCDLDDDGNLALGGRVPDA